MVLIEAAVGWLVSPFINLIFNKTQTFIENKYFEKSDIEDDMRKINTTLGRILSIMSTVEQQRIVNLNEMQLVQEIKDAVCDAEDVMDEFEYDFLEKNANKKQVALAACTTLAIYQAIANSKDFKKKVKVVGERLDRARESAKVLLDLMITKSSGNVQLAVPENQPLTSSLVSEEKIIGLDNERKSLTDLLFEEVDGPPTIISIIGQGGIGKTTLAQLVVNDLRVRNHFDQIIWLTVSDNFDKLRLTKEILKDVCENFSTQNASFNKLQKLVERVLEFKKILLMLDDVWYVKDDNKRHSYEMGWLEFLAPWKKAKSGSKIMVTTRQNIVTSSLTSFGLVRTIPLSGLNDDHSWSLFKLKAFDGFNCNNLQELEPIGRKIVKKLQGLALAIRVVGMALRGKSDIEEWKKVLNDTSLDSTDIMKILYRSYENLPEHLQRCFAYCSLFPKDYHLKRDHLVHMWIAQGFVHPQEGEILEKEKNGQTYFDELIARSFIQMIKRDYKEHYVIHDLMNDLARHVSKGECYILKNGDSIQNLGSIQHLSVTNGEEMVILRNMHGLSKLRTLVFLNCIQFPKSNLIDEVFIKLKRIRVLDFDWCLDSLPNVAECKHLRYLCFRYHDGLKLAPETFSKLHQLVMLFLRKQYKHQKKEVYDLLNLPESICRLSSLAFVDISKSLYLDVCTYAKFLSLWRGGTILADVRKGRALDQLQYLNKIKGKVVIVGLENVGKWEDATKAQLGSKEHVTKLCLTWKGTSSKMVYNKVLNALSPNRNIEWLEINGYPGLHCAKWLESLCRLKSIQLEKCHGLKILPPLGQLPWLITLHIKSMNSLSKLGDEFYGSGTFPSLEEFVIKNMGSLTKWSFPSGVQSFAFAKLSKLEINGCPLLVGPGWDGFPALQELQVCTSHALTMKEELKGDGGLPPLTRMEIDDCQGIITLEAWQKLATLKELIIKSCPNLLSLPEMDFFYSLVFLEVTNCPKLRSLPENGLPASLQNFYIRETHRDLEEQLQNKNGPEWDKVAKSWCRCLISQGFVWKIAKEGS